MPLLKNARGALWAMTLTIAATLSDPVWGLAFPKLQTLTLSNGIRVDFAPYEKDDDVRVTLMFNGGNGSDPDVPPYTLATALSFARWGGDDAEKISEVLARYNAALSTGCGPSVCFVELLAPTGKLDGALQFMGSLLRASPPFFEKRFAEAREETTVSLISAAQKSDPARNQLVESLYGPGHPFNREVVRAGLADQMRHLTFDRLLTTFERWVRPDNVRILVVGNLSAKQVQAMFERRFGDWERPPSPLSLLPIVSRPQPSSRSRVILVDKPGAERVSIAAGVAFEFPDPAHYADLSAYFTFGQVLGMRLKNSLLDTQQSRYAAANVSTIPWGQYLDMDVDASPANVHEVLTLARRHYEELISDRPAEPAEVAYVREHGPSWFERRFESEDVDARMTYYREQVVINLGDHPYALISRNLGSVTPKKIRDLMHRLNAASPLTWVIVGDARQIEEPIRDLKLGEVVIVH